MVYQAHQNKISKSDMNLELLKAFEYSTEERTNAADGKLITVYI